MIARRIMLFLVATGLLLTVTGCVGDARTGNQGGGTLLSAAMKLLEGKIGELTADEWQILGDNIPKLAEQFGIQGVSLPILTDEQAAAIVDFLDTHGINTIEELDQALSSGAIDEDDIPPELLEVF